MIPSFVVLYVCINRRETTNIILGDTMIIYATHAFQIQRPGRVAQSVGHLTRELGVLVWQHTFVSPSAFSRRAVVSYWRKYVHEVLVNRLGGLSLPRKRKTDSPDMTLDVYGGRKTTVQQQQQKQRLNI